MDSKVWGPSAWTFLHSVTMAYPEVPSEQEKKNIEDFFVSLGNVIPCPICKEHFQQNIINMPIKHNSRNELTYWLFLFHNDVNKNLGKQEMNFDKFIVKYKELYSKKKNPKNYEINLNILFLIIIIIIATLFITFLKK